MGKKRPVKHPKKGVRTQHKPISPELGKRFASDVEGIAKGLCEDETIELVHVECVTEMGTTILRVYIDKPGGVTMADCTNISRQLGDIMDATLTIDTEYRLEVSSPGIYRPLFKKEDYTRFAGRNVEVKLKKAFEGKKKLTGTLKGVTKDNSILLSVDGSDIEIDYLTINSARLSDDNGDNRC